MLNKKKNEVIVNYKNLNDIAKINLDLIIKKFMNLSLVLPQKKLKRIR